MSVDIYQPCPCGSGKKFKFCCHVIADDMDRIGRLIDGNQFRVALQQLEQLAKKQPKNPWVGTTRAMMLLDVGDPAGARDVLEALLQDHPDNELAIVLYAAAMARTERGELAKRALHRAFQRSAKKMPALVSDLAFATASTHFSTGHLSAAREHLALALRLASEDRRQDLFVKLLEVDGAEEIPYPLRGSHHLPKISGSDEIQTEVRKAQKYAAVGCWSIAADLFLKMANAAPDRAEFWHSVGLCRAWDGDEKAAAESLHRAARHYQDIGVAVECEAIAQFLDDKTGDLIESCAYLGRINSVSRLLSLFDALPRMVRLRDPGERDSEERIVASYVVLDRDSNDVDYSNSPLEDIPRVLARVMVSDADPKTNEPASLVLTGDRGTTLDDAKVLVSAAAGEFLEWATDVAQPQIVGATSSESRILDNRWFLPRKMPITSRRKLHQRFCELVINDVWPRQPLRALSGKTPEQAVNDVALRIPLLASIYVFNARGQQRERGIDLKRIFARLGIDPLPPLEVTVEANLSALSIMQIYRLPVDRLSDEQLITVVNRAMLIRQDESLYEVLKTAANRPGCAEHLDLARTYGTLMDICTATQRRDEAFEWIDRARSMSVPAGKTAFQHSWTWDMAELRIRLEDPNDPGLNPLYERFVNYYGPKVPQVRPLVEQTLANYGIPSPWDSIKIVTSTQMSESSGLWNPSAPQPVPSGGKLWLPGQ